VGADALEPDPPAGSEPAREAPQALGLLPLPDQNQPGARQRAREAYLAQSRDVFEVERRMRDLERDIGSRYY
jgi:hypothetical protein